MAKKKDEPKDGRVETGDDIAAPSAGPEKE